MAPKYNRFRGHDVVTMAIDCLIASLIQSTHYYFFIIQEISYEPICLYPLVVISLVSPFLLNKYEKESCKNSTKNNFLKDETFRADIKEKIHTTENINDVIAYINKTYHLGMLSIKRHYRSIEINLAIL